MRYLAIACVSVVLAFAASSRSAIAGGMEEFPKDAEFVALLESPENAFILSARTVYLPLTEVLYYEAKVWDAVEQDVVTVYVSLDSVPLSSADIQVFRQAERQTFAVQYGVVEPALKSLVDTVQLATPDASFGVVVWLQQLPSERLDKGLIQLSPAWFQ